MSLEIAEQKIQEAIVLRNSIQCEPALETLKAVLADYPNHPDGNYQMAWTCEAMGHDDQAIRYYEAALANGLSGMARQRAYLGLGNTYRAVGEIDKSATTFDAAVKEFPENRAIKAFYALTLHDLKRYGASTEMLIRQLVDTTSDVEIQHYARSLRYLSEELRDQSKANTDN